MTSPLPPIFTARRHGYDALRPAIRGGELVRVRRGVYVRAESHDERWAERRAVVLARCAAVTERLTCPYVFSHTTAALLHGWPVSLRDDKVHITQLVNPGARTPRDVRRHVRARLPACVLVDGLPTTTPLATVVECARFLDPCSALMTADGAFRALADVRVFDREASLARQESVRRESLSALADVGRGRHVVRARAVLTWANGLAQSPGESWARWLALVAGLPAPILQWELLADGRRFFTDLGWDTSTVGTQRGVAVEYDGTAKYEGDVRKVLAAEKTREDAIRELDVRVVRLTAEDLSDPAGATARLLAAFPPRTIRRLEPRPALTHPPRARRPAAGS